MRNDDIPEFYIQSEGNIIPYDKAYFDSEDNKYPCEGHDCYDKR